MTTAQCSQVKTVPCRWTAYKVLHPGPGEDTLPLTMCIPAVLQQMYSPCSNLKNTDFGRLTSLKVKYAIGSNFTYTTSIYSTFY